MKRFLLMATILCCVSPMVNAGMDKVVAKIADVSMTATKSVDTTSKIRGYLNRIDVVFGNSTSTVNMTVVASNELTGLTTTLPVLGFTSTNVSYQLTNYVQRLVLHDETITLTATNAAYTNQSVVIAVFYERP